MHVQLLLDYFHLVLKVCSEKFEFFLILYLSFLVSLAILCDDPYNLIGCLFPCIDILVPLESVFGVKEPEQVNEFIDVVGILLEEGIYMQEVIVKNVLQEQALATVSLSHVLLENGLQLLSLGRVEIV